MCKEDVRLGRAAHARTPVDQTATGAGQFLIFPANPNRYGLTMALRTTTTLAAAICAIVYTKVGGAKYPLACLTIGHPSAAHTIVTAGDAIQGDVWLDVPASMTAASVLIGETVWDQELRDI